MNDLVPSSKWKDSTYLFVQKVCGHRWLENGKALKSSILPTGNYMFKWRQSFVFIGNFEDISYHVLVFLLLL